MFWLLEPQVALKQLRKVQHPQIYLFLTLTNLEGLGRNREWQGKIGLTYHIDIYQLSKTQEPKNQDPERVPNLSQSGFHHHHFLRVAFGVQWHQFTIKLHASQEPKQPAAISTAQVLGKNLRAVHSSKISLDLLHWPILQMNMPTFLLELLSLNWLQLRSSQCRMLGGGICGDSDDGATQGKFQSGGIQR